MEITLRQVSKRYLLLDALKEVNATIEPGEIVAVLGLNGAGKTTLLQCLAGIVQPTSGEILFDGEHLRRDRLDLRRRFAFMPDMPFLFPDLTPIRHIGMVLKLYEKTYAGIEDRVVDILRGLDLLPLAESRIGTLSRGQAYKVGLAALMAAEPELLMLDEPFASGMDTQGMSAMKLFSREAASRGKTVVYTTQILEVAEAFSHRVMILNRGEVFAFDRLERLLTMPGDDLSSVFKRLREQRS